MLTAMINFSYTSKETRWTLSQKNFTNMEGRYKPMEPLILISFLQKIKNKKIFI